MELVPNQISHCEMISEDSRHSRHLYAAHRLYPISLVNAFLNEMFAARGSTLARDVAFVPLISVGVHFVFKPKR